MPGWLWKESGENMKKILIPVIIFMAALIGFITFGISRSFAKVQYEKDVMGHVMSVGKEGDLEAQYNGTKTNVVGQNVRRINSVLTVSEMERVYKKPPLDEDRGVFLSFPDGAEFILIEDPEVEDGAYIRYSYKKKVRWYRVEGYETMMWVTRAISPEGIYTENEMIFE